MISRLQPDIVHSWLFTANACTRLVTAGRAAPRVIVSERCVDVWKSNWQLWLDRRQIRRTARLVANSRSVAEFYQELGFPDSRIVVIRNGIAVPQTHDPNRAATLAEFDIPPGARVIGYVGRLARQKRVPDLIWAMQLLRQVTENVYMLVVGDGPDRDRCEDRVANFGCGHLVRFAGHRSDGGKLISCMDVFWLGSDFEGSSNSLMEAMAAGVPVVASDIPPNRELIGDGVAFCQFTDRLLADRELADRLGTAARRRMQTRFSIGDMIAAHVELYRDVTGNMPQDLPQQDT